MKARIQVASLREALNQALSVVDKRNTRPILTHCLLKFENEILQLSATDLEVSIQIRVKSTIERPGSFCINSKHLVDILKQLPDELIELEVEGQSHLTITGPNIRYSLLIIGPEEYPLLHFEENDFLFKIPKKEIISLITHTSFAISQDETRLFLNGIFFHNFEDRLRAVAIDGHRLALLDSPNVQVPSAYLDEGIIVPKKGIYELKKLAELTNGDDLQLQVDNTFLYARTDEEHCLSIRLISRDYPKYDSIIPQKTQFFAEIDRNLFLSTVKRVRILSNEQTNGIKIKIDPEQITIYADHSTIGHAEEKIDVSYDGPGIEIGLNARYLIEALSVIDDHSIELGFNNSLSPLIVRAKETPEFLAIIMPLRI